MSILSIAEIPAGVIKEIEFRYENVSMVHYGEPLTESCVLQHLEYTEDANGFGIQAISPRVYSYRAYGVFDDEKSSVDIYGVMMYTKTKHPIWS